MNNVEQTTATVTLGGSRKHMYIVRITVHEPDAAPMQSTLGFYQAYRDAELAFVACAETARVFCGNVVMRETVQE